MPFFSWHSSLLYPHFSRCCFLALWDSMGGPSSWLATGLANTNDLALEVPVPCLWTCTRAGCSVNDSWQFDSWCCGCQPCSLPRFWSLCGTQVFHWSVFAEREPYQANTECQNGFIFFGDWLVGFFCFASNAPGSSHLIPLQLFVFYVYFVYFFLCALSLSSCGWLQYIIYLSFSCREYRVMRKQMVITPHPTTVVFEAVDLCASAEGSDAEYRKPKARMYFTAWKL